MAPMATHAERTPPPDRQMPCSALPSRFSITFPAPGTLYALTQLPSSCMTAGSGVFASRRCGSSGAART